MRLVVTIKVTIKPLIGNPKHFLTYLQSFLTKLERDTKGAYVANIQQPNKS